MAHAIGCMGSPIELRNKRTPMTKAQRETNRKLVPRRNQTRAIGFIKICREGETPKVRAIRAGHAHHYQTALAFATVEIVRNEKGQAVTLKRPK